MTLPKCPAGCGRVQNSGMFLCRSCWFRVPKEFRDEVWRTWKAYRAVPAGMSPDVMSMRHAARLAYQQARENALATL